MFLTKVSLKKKMMVGGIVPMVLIIGLGMMSFQSINDLLSIHFCLYYADSSAVLKESDDRVIRGLN